MHTVHTCVHTITQHCSHNAITKLDSDQVLLSLKLKINFMNEGQIAKSAKYMSRKIYALYGILSTAGRARQRARQTEPQVHFDDKCEKHGR